MKKVLWISDFFETGYGSASYEFLKNIVDYKDLDINLLIVNRHDLVENIKKDAHAKLPQIPINNIYTIDYRDELENIYKSDSEKEYIKVL